MTDDDPTPEAEDARSAAQPIPADQPEPPGRWPFPKRARAGRMRGLALAVVMVSVVSLATVVAVVATAPVDRVTLIVERTPRSIELFMALPAEVIPGVFGALPEELVDTDGTIDIARLRGGTWKETETLAQAMNARLDGRPQPLEGMSLMLHPKAQPMPFAGPWDGLVATSVCTALVPSAPPTLVDLDLYVGFIAHGVDGFGNLGLGFPSTGRPGLRVHVLEYADGRLRSDRWATLEDGGLVTFSARSTR